jgi:hypothetical protein
MSIETRGDISKALQLGVHGFFGASYKKFNREFEDLYQMETSEKAFEERVELVNIGIAPVKNEGASVSYASIKQGSTYRATHLSYAIGLIISRETIEDNLYMEVAKVRTEAIARSISNTENIIGLQFLNRAFDAGFARADGVPLCSASHPTAIGTTQSNLLNVDLSHAALEDAVILAEQTLANDGSPIMVKSQALVVPTSLKLTANKILQSVNQSGTANNDINILKALGVFPEGVKDKRNLTAGWFVTTDIGKPIYFEREKAKMSDDVDFDSGNFKMHSMIRCSQLIDEFRHVIGSDQV